MREKINLHKIMCFAYSCCLVLIVLIGGFMFGVGSNPITDTDLNKYSAAQVQDYQVGANNSTTTIFDGSNVMIPFVFVQNNAYSQFPAIYKLENFVTTKTASTSWQINFYNYLLVYNGSNNYLYANNTKTFSADLTGDWFSPLTYIASPTSTAAAFYVYYQYAYTLGSSTGLGDFVGCSYGSFLYQDYSTLTDSAGYRIAFDYNSWNTPTNNDSTMFYLSYFDKNGSSFTIFFRTSIANSAPKIDPRTYYFGVGSDNDYYNQGYNSGFGEGYREGYGVGNNEGIDSGYDTGYNQGYHSGVIAGRAEANDYTFLGLFSAVIDAPIEAFRGLFNVNIFGVNMFDFLSAFFTFALAMLLLRYIIK